MGQYVSKYPEQDGINGLQQTNNFVKFKRWTIERSSNDSVQDSKVCEMMKQLSIERPLPRTPPAMDKNLPPIQESHPHVLHQLLVTIPSLSSALKVHISASNTVDDVMRMVLRSKKVRSGGILSDQVEFVAQWIVYPKQASVMYGDTLKESRCKKRSMQELKLSGEQILFQAIMDGWNLMSHYVVSGNYVKLKMILQEKSASDGYGRPVEAITSAKLPLCPKTAVKSKVIKKQKSMQPSKRISNTSGKINARLRRQSLAQFKNQKTSIQSYYRLLIHYQGEQEECRRVSLHITNDLNGWQCLHMAMRRLKLYDQDQYAIVCHQQTGINVQQTVLSSDTQVLQFVQQHPNGKYYVIKKNTVANE
ncbi:hypothetical protein MIR68_010275 [Amoeboaphelidium protococcarum]|nr:hypothetical protein MIR68_010275 [Amoeboaphelidium protococcarum]